MTDTKDTIFIRNLSFDTDEESLKKFIEDSFGETKYCLICKDKETDEPKGTAFAKFTDPQNAIKCLREFKSKDSEYKFNLDGRNLMIFPAISRDKVHEIKQTGDKKKDKRNLALAREGYIDYRSDEAKEMSKIDLDKRRALADRKKEKLKNLHNFVSETRLCIHNLPPSCDDEKLRKICLNSVLVDNPESKPKIMECRVMRNKKAGGKLATSKGFAFVAFSKHEHALAALKNLNNNPNTFTKDRRPIVEFSIENLVAINKKKTREAHSKQKNKQQQQKSAT